jgi:hypothetical protein
MSEHELPDKRAVRRSFERASSTYDRHSVLQSEVGTRLLAHLEPMTLEPRRVLDLGLRHRRVAGTPGGALSEVRGDRHRTLAQGCSRAPRHARPRGSASSR